MDGTELNFGQRILKIANEKHDGWVFTAYDMLDAGKYSRVGPNLSRLELAKKIRRVGFGFYDLPIYDALNEKFKDPNMEEAMAACARRSGHIIVKGDDLVAHEIGLLVKRPLKNTYLTNGRSDHLKFLTFDVALEKVSQEYLDLCLLPYGKVYQALLCLGERTVDSRDDVQSILAKTITLEVLEAMSESDISSIPRWMKQVASEALSIEKTNTTELKNKPMNM